VSKLDIGACSGLTGGGRMKMGSEIFGFSVEGDGNPKSAAGKKIEECCGSTRDFWIFLLKENSNRDLLEENGNIYEKGCSLAA
jgi:hypothetical protein